MATKTKTQDIMQKGSQWLRVGVLTITTLGPIVGTLLERVRNRANKGNQPAAQVQTTVKGKVQEAQQRLEELTLASRQQAQQLQQQAEQLRKALREEARQRAKLAKQMRKAGRAWGQDVLKHGEQITGDIKERADSLSREITKRTGKVAQDLSERGSELVQKRGRMLSIIGFSAGVVAAGVVTFIMVRRFVHQNNEQDQQIELPSENAAIGSASEMATRAQAQPAGEIVMLNADGSMVTITEPESKGE